jgi:hypothetical protein
MEYQPRHCDVPAQRHNSAKAKYCRRNYVGAQMDLPSSDVVGSRDHSKPPTTI